MPMGRPPLHDDAKLKQDMVDCLWQLGYDAPISAVVQSTGAKAASLYARFGSKKGMLLAALDVYAEDHLADLHRLLNSMPPGPERIRAVLEKAIDCFDDPLHRGCFVVYGGLEANAGEAEFAERLQKHMADIRTEFSWALAETPGLSGFFSIEGAAWFLQAQIWGLKIMARLNPQRELGQRLVEQAMYALFGPDAVKGRPEDSAVSAEDGGAAGIE